jgi:hypothetical protein
MVSYVRPSTVFLAIFLGLPIRHRASQNLLRSDRLRASVRVFRLRGKGK